MEIKRYHDFIFETLRGYDTLDRIKREKAGKLRATPEEIVEMIKRDCQPFLKEIRYSVTDNYLLRGYMRGLDNLDSINRMQVRKDRKPLHTNKFIHDEFDFYFEDRWGVRPRSEGVFATGDYAQASLYGRPYLFFPIGEFQYFWSDEIYDLHAYLSDTKIGYMQSPKKWSKEDKEEVSNIIEDIVYDKYTDENLLSAIHEGHEVMFICDEYYLVNENMGRKLSNLLQQEI